MSQVLIHFDEATLKAIDRIAPAAKRKRADFIRQAVKDAIFRRETERMREAYRLQPDSAEGVETLGPSRRVEGKNSVKQFEVWWADLPQPAGRRPVLLLSRNDAYGYLSKFVVVEITSTIRGIASEIRLGEEEGLPADCVANCDNLRTVPRLALRKRAGQLDPERWVEVKRAAGAALGWRELTDIE